MKTFTFNTTLLATLTLALLLSTGWNRTTFADDPSAVTAPTVTIKEVEKQEEVKLQKSDQFAADQAKAMNRIPGVSVNAADLKETTVKKKAKPGFNPLGWLFRPITRLQEQSLRLEQQMMKLTGPIAALQPGMLRLEKRIVGVEGQTERVQNQMALMQRDISAMRTELGEIKEPIMELKEPIMALRQPLNRIEKPITGVDKDLTEVKALLSLVLTSIYIAAAVIAFGTPLAAILVWRNRRRLIPPAKPGEANEDMAVAGANRQFDRSLRKSA